MKLLNLLLLPVLLLSLFSSSVFAQTFPKPTGYVNDFAELYSERFERALEQELEAVEASTSAEIAVVTVKDLQETSIDDYAVRLFENWKIGKDKKDNGVLMLIAEKEREARIEVGYGLEGVITDARAGRIIRDTMIPAFKAGDYERGTQDAVTVLKKYIRGEAVPEEKAPSDQDWSGWFDFIPFLFFGVVYLGSFLARSKDYYVGGFIGGVVGVIIGVIIGQLAAILFSAFALAMFGLLLDYVLSRNYQRLKSQNKSTDWWGSRGGFYGGGGGRGFGGGGGFGGFGGGSSGGGGASGRW
jgi:uncharacterized protein